MLHANGESILSRNKGESLSEHCCHSKTEDLKSMAREQARVLWIVLLLNIAGFILEFYSGLRFHSASLSADSLDMLGDSLAYASSLYVINLGTRAKIRSSQFKGILMLLFGIFVGIKTIYEFLSGQYPDAHAMSVIGIVVLAINTFCLFLLTKHKNDDINFKSVWLCSRNDMIANISVLCAAGLVAYTSSKIPDVIVGIGIAVLFLKSSFVVLSEARQAI